MTVASVWFSRSIFDLLLGLDRLVQAVAPAASRHQAAGELVDDDDLAVLHHVVDVELEERVRAQRLVDVVLDVGVLEVVDVAAVEPMLAASARPSPCRSR